MEIRQIAGKDNHVLYRKRLKFNLKTITIKSINIVWLEQLTCQIDGTRKPGVNKNNSVI